MHISLYIALVLLAQGKQHLDPVQVSARKLMPLAKIGGKTPYHRTMLELAEYGYIRYEPSFNPNKASLVYMVDDGSTPEQNDEKYH